MSSIERISSSYASLHHRYATFEEVEAKVEWHKIEASKILCSRVYPHSRDIRDILIDVQFSRVRLRCTGCTPWNPPPGGWKDGTPGMRSPGLIKDLIGVIIVMRFRHGMMREKRQETAREEEGNWRCSDHFGRIDFDFDLSFGRRKLVIENRVVNI